MTSHSTATASLAGSKRSHQDDSDSTWQPEVRKRARPTLGFDGKPDTWTHHDSVLSTPIASYQHAKYDSDDQSSMVSEPGSPQDMLSSGEDMDMDDLPSYPLSPDQHAFPKPSKSSNRAEARHRVATPFAGHIRPGTSAMHIRTGFKHHVRDRHPQEIVSSDHLEVPSPIDEDKVPTPPSAADAAGSQLSQLSVNDMDIEVAEHVPAITVHPARGSHNAGVGDADRGLFMRKQRQRSGAQSNGSVSPRPGAEKRGISIGYRADCEKCRMKVPGHMNHFTS